MRHGQARVGCGLLALMLLTLTLLSPQGGVAGSTRAVAQGGALSSWGWNMSGQLGDGTQASRDEPVRVIGTGPSGLAFVAIDAGTGFSIGLTADGSVYAWGENTYGLLGAGAPDYSFTPRKVAGTGPGGIVLTTISAGAAHALGLTADGTAYAWGYNNEGRLGNGVSSGTSATLVKVSGTGPGGLIFTAVAGGGLHSLGLADNGTVYAWGWNFYGQLGNGVTGTSSSTPVPVSGGTTFTAIAGGQVHSLALTANGTAYGWGYNQYGQLGNGTGGSFTNSNTPVQVSDGIVFTAIDAGFDHSLGLKADGTAYGWGHNNFGQVGNGTSEAYYTTPQPVSGTGSDGLVFTAVAAGGYHNLGLSDDGTAYAWGGNSEGQLGIGTSGDGQNRTAPVAVTGTGAGGSLVAAIAAGLAHSVASGDASDPNCAGFVDLPADDPACPAIVSLTPRGIILGYAGVPPRFGPDDNVQRAQVAVFLVRALQWQNRPTGPRSFTDLNLIAAELRNASLIIANACPPVGSCVANGYGDGRFGPTDTVTHAQVITFLARAFALDPVQAWAPQPGEPQPHTGVPAVHDTDVRTYVFYAGTIPDAPTTATGWNSPASRAWVARVLHQALTVQP